MTDSRHYDTVAFDVRENATMLFFARTTRTGDIGDYLLGMQVVLPDGFTPQRVNIEVQSRTRSISSIEESFSWATSQG